MCLKRSLDSGGREGVPFAGSVESKSKGWIPACAGMTAGEARDSGWESRDESTQRALRQRPRRMGSSEPCRSAIEATKNPPIKGSVGLDEAPGSDLLSHGLSHTTIGAGAFHFRVRDGIGWDHAAISARELGESRC